MTQRAIRTLVVDDSVFMRTMLKTALSKSPEVEVIGSAQNGNEALVKIEKLKPDVVTLDIEMPGLTGLEVLERVMKSSKPLPIVMVSTKTQVGAQMTFEALELGAVDFVAKPLADKNTSLQRFQEKVVGAVKAAFASNRKQLGRKSTIQVAAPTTAPIETDGIVIAIGISAGGPATLHKLIPALPNTLPPIVVTQHMSADFTAPFAKRLDAVAQLTVKEAERGDKLLPGQLLLAPGNQHLKVRRRGSTLLAQLDNGPKVSGFRPSVDAMFSSLATAAGNNVIALVMTGMGNDGAAGTRELKEKGARTLAQDQETSIVYGMPKAAFETGCVDQVVSLSEIPNVLVQMLSPASSTTE